jgi:adhesin transport system outer membrane protein
MLKKIVLSLVASVIVSQAQTLQQSVEHVLETNPIVMERLANYRETSKDLSIARSEYLPTLDLVSSLGHENTDYVNTPTTSLNYYENSLTLMWNIFNGFSTNTKVDYQKSRIVAAAYNFIEKADDTAFQITRDYIEVIKQRELLDISKENLRINQEILSKVKDLYTSGATTKSEMRKIQSSLALARSNLVVQESNIIDAQFNFKRYYGDSVEASSLEIPDFNVYLPKTLEEATSYAIRNNPSMMVENYNIKAAEYLREEQKSAYYPKIDLMAQQNLDNSTYGVEGKRDRFRAGVVLSYNFFRGGADSDTIQKSISSIRREVETKNELQRETTEGLELSWSAYTMLSKQLEELKKYESYSNETVNLYQQEYDLGKRTLLDLLTAQNDLMSAKSQIATAKYNLLFAKYRILDAMGLLVAGVMGNDYKYMKQVGIVGHDAVKNLDTLPISYDSDKDGVANNDDLCQASDSNDSIIPTGCTKNAKDRFSKVEHFGLIKFDRNGTMNDSKMSMANIDNIVDTLKTNKDKLAKVVIQSDSSDSGDSVQDRDLSAKYAQSVKNMLVQKGVDEKQIEISADGSGSPISSDKDLNDRVNVYMYLK